jgi:hypothetical protein
MPRPHKGDRHPLTVRLPRSHHTRYLAEANLRGVDLGTYLVARLAVAHGLSSDGADQLPLLHAYDLLPLLHLGEESVMT